MPSWRLFLWKLNLAIGKWLHPDARWAWLEAEHPTQPTARDKPSPHSSLPMAELMAKARREWPAPRFAVSQAANTNSMEPLIDDNCVLVLEELSDEVKSQTPLSPGDVVVYPHQGREIIHMLYRQRKIGGAPWWPVGGWNNYFADGEVCEADITHRLAGLFYGQPRRPKD
jgi:hypothetical protein